MRGQEGSIWPELELRTTFNFNIIIKSTVCVSPDSHCQPWFSERKEKVLCFTFRCTKKDKTP